MPAAAPVAPAMPAAPGGGGPEAGPSVAVPTPQPEAVVSMDPVHVADRQALDSQLTRPIPPGEALRSIVPGVSLPGENSNVEHNQTATQPQAPETSQPDASVSEAQQTGQVAGQEASATAQTQTGAAEDQQPTNETAAANQPSEETIKQALIQLGLDDTQVNREIARHLIEAKAQQGEAQENVEAAEKEETFNPLFMEYAEYVIENPDEAVKFAKNLREKNPEVAEKFRAQLEKQARMLLQKKDSRWLTLLTALLIVGGFYAYTVAAPGQQ